MSGDVQPRKRKDKKRRKDDIDPVPVLVHHPPIFVNNSVSDDVNIHIHKEDGTGGNICAKLVFFVLFSALAVLIGLIITEHRGLTDLDSADTESRFSHIFEGLVDAGSDTHDHEDSGIEESLEVDHTDDHDENEEVNASEPDDEEATLSEEEDKSSADDHSKEYSIEEDTQEDELDEENDSAVSEEEEVNQSEEDEDDFPPDDDILEDDDEEIEDTVEESAENYQDEQQDSEEENEDQKKIETGNVEEYDDEDTDDETDDNADEAKAIDDDDETGGSDEEDSIESKKATSIEDSDEGKVASSENLNKEIRKDDIDNVSEEKEVVEEIVEGEQMELHGDAQESSGLAVKLGVGVAILVVAHLVLVRKWRTAADGDSKPTISKEQKEAVPDLARRNTIVPPPSYQEIEPDLEENDEEDYSDEELSDDDEELSVEPKTLKAKYHDLQATYSRSLTPESDPGHEKSTKTDEYEDEENLDEEEDEISDEDDYENEEEYDENDDEELLNRLEAKYGKLHGVGGNLVADNSWKRINSPQDMAEDSDSDRESDDGDYEHSNITNKDDFQIRNEIDEAQKSVEHNPSHAVKLFDAILRKNPSSPRSLYGKAVSLDALADEKQSNDILHKALKIYNDLLKREDVPPVLYRLVADRCINRMRFIGQYKSLVAVHLLVIKEFPDDPKHRNDLAVTYLTINRVEDARSVLKDVLKRWPRDGVALVHYGFILKTVDKKLKEAVHYFKKGLKTGDEGVVDGRFYFHLGDALTRLGRKEDANKVYADGANHMVFLSKYQRSLYNVPRLTGKPWWRKKEIENPLLLDLLEQQWTEIRKEGLSVLNEEGYFQDESENLKDTGDWKQFELYARGKKNAKNCRKCPITCSIIDQIPEARSCKRGQTKFSVMHPATHVWPHCGPTNCRLRTHLGLTIPPNTFIRVGDQTRSWKEGEVIIFDDSFEHEVWHNGTGIRLVLIVDICHPELTPKERRSLSAI